MVYNVTSIRSTTGTPLEKLVCTVFREHPERRRWTVKIVNINGRISHLGSVCKVPPDGGNSLAHPVNGNSVSLVERKNRKGQSQLLVGTSGARFRLCRDF